MRVKFNSIKRGVLVVMAGFLGVIAINVPNTYADDIVFNGAFSGFMLSPMTQRLSLDPGDTYTNSFYIMNPEQNIIPVNYALEVKSFYRTEEGEALFEDVEGRGQLASWITLEVPDSGTLEPGASVEVFYTINVPLDVPSGGQYASITATSASTNEASPNAANINESVAMAYTIFAEVSGETKHGGVITDINIPGFLFDGNITASSRVQNTGNIHGTATYTIKIYPLFSDQPVYTNENDPDKKLILPDRGYRHEDAWEETPTVGIFNVVYDIEFDGVATERVERLVIKCPIWLLLLIMIIIITLITLVVIRVKRRIKRNKLFSVS